MKGRRNPAGWLIIFPCVLFLMLIARDADAVPSFEPLSAATQLQVRTPTRTMVPTVTGFPTRTPTLTPTIFPPGTPTFTVTPTSQPGKPILIYPPDGALLPQPVSPNDWFFVWEARHGPCYSSIGIYEDSGYSISAHKESDEPYEFEYTADAYLPDDALGPWHWYAYVGCPLGSNFSGTFTFWVQPPPVRYRYLPLVEKGPR